MKPQPRTRARVEAFLRHPNIEDCDALRPRRSSAAPKPIAVKPIRTPLTFEQKLALVASGRARIIEVPRIPTRGFEQSLTGNSAAMMAAA